MIQKMILLRKENDLLNALKGQSFNEKSKFEAYKILQQIHEKADYACMSKALCYVTNKGEIKGVGGSSLMQDKNGEIHSDLILDTFGQWLSGIFKGGILSRTVFFPDETGVVKGVVTYNNVSFLYNDSVTFRTLMQLGSGITAPARTDFDIDTALATAPENTFFESTIPTYNLTNFNFKNSGQVTAGGPGTINESILQTVWFDNVLSVRIFTMFRDIISPAVPFVIGDSLNLEYTVQI